MKLSILFSAVLMLAASAASALTFSEMKAQISENGLEMLLKGDDGTVFGVATITPKTWTGDEFTGYDVRFAAGTKKVTIDSVVYQPTFWSMDSETLGYKVELGETPVGGQFVTGLRGKLEKWETNGSNERMVVVFRNAEGQFVTHVEVTDYVESYWETTSENVDRYVTRWKAGTGPLAGQFVNSRTIESTLLDKAKAYHMVPGKRCPVLAVRDSADGTNNGKFLTSIWGQWGLKTVAGEKRGFCYYSVTRKDGTKKVITSGLESVLNDY